MIKLVAALFVKKHLDWFILNNLVQINAGSKLSEQINNLIRDLGKESLNICEGFGIPHHSIYAPIYTGYKEYYQVDKTQGEHYNLRSKF
jgi:hypothetical protein